MILCCQQLQKPGLITDKGALSKFFFGLNNKCNIHAYSLQIFIY